ncbi:MAG TPA: thiamine phosphate synthase [Gemmatimonadales bacterium]|nr:thiamine phosphate synthase [Gemmatimonadales bacterium]
MRPLPRVHAVTDAAVLALDDLGVRAAAIAAAGPAVALHARTRAAPDRAGAGEPAAGHPAVRALAAAAARFVTLARPAEAAVFVSGRADLAAAVGAQGVQLASADLAPADARRILPRGWIGRSVHSLAEAIAARDEGADFLLAGPVYETASHPGRPAAGLALIRECAALGLPVIAIGGITAERAAEARDAGAFGVAAIRALWLAPDPAAATLDLLNPWLSFPPCPISIS